MPPEPAPPPEMLRGFVRGLLPDPEAERVAAWIDRDLASEELLRRVPAADTLVDALSTVRSAPLPPDPAAERLVESLSGADRPAPGEPPPATAPVRLGDYRLVRLLGQGGMGAVYEAFDERLKRRAAVKVIRGAVTDEARERFLRECRAAAALDSEYIVRVYGAGEDGGVLFLAMEYVEGPSLEKWLRDRDGPVPEAEVRWAARELLCGLRDLHARGLMHRDLKPANAVVVPRDGRPHRIKLLDFGLARLADGSDAVTQPNGVVGTPEYMAPEQAGAKPLTAKCDLFSLGAVLYRMASGESPFRRGSLVETLAAVALDTPVPLEGVSDAFNAFVFRLLAKDPGRRPGTDEALAQLAALDTPPVPPAPVRLPATARGRWKWLLGVGASLIVVIIIVRERESPNRGATPESEPRANPKAAGPAEARPSREEQAKGTGKAVSPPPPSAPHAAATDRIEVGARVRVTRQTAGYADISRRESPFLHPVPEGTTGEVVRVSPDGGLIQVRVEASPGAAVDVWVDRPGVRAD